MSMRRREQLIRCARRFDALIIADDVYDFLRWTPLGPDETLVPRLVDVDHTLDGGIASPFGNVVSNGSFSKILGPGLRTGWTESTDTFAVGLSECGSTRSGGSASQFVASVVAQMIQSGALEQHLHQHLLPALQRRSVIAMEAVRDHLALHGALLDADKIAPSRQEELVNLSSTACSGGYYLYIHLPASIGVREFARLARKDENVLVGSGETFEVRGDERSVPIRSAMRLCIAWEDEEQIAEGIRRLGRLLQRMLNDRVDPMGQRHHL
ncbi:MAG: aminotransferase class I/II-fold pyridoxal phosphate-dependent enzyme [Terriglobus roseus]|nr:aminotransferase class I/II-fold pyridoxal phosphate-dependent enzyme [Terriglobus roseus]